MRMCTRSRRALASADVVDTTSIEATRDTMRDIVSACNYAGELCTQPQALAAAFSVPNGAPISMACVNVGPFPSNEVCDKFDAWTAVERSNNRAFARGPRY